MSYPALLSPISINQLVLPTKVMMGSMHVGLEGEENGLEKMKAFYVRRAREHVGLIVTGGAAVTPEGSGGANFMSLYQDKDIEQWTELTEAVHEAGGRIAVQLFHAGRYAYKALTGLDPVSASALQSSINPDVPVELSEENIQRTIQAFSDAAVRAKKSGFDAVEIMGSEGYLLNQFMSPLTNHRTDQWGGSFENRLRFPLTVAEAVRRAVGPDYPVIFRMSGLDLMEGSTTEEETIIWAGKLEEAGMDALNIGIGWHESRTPTITMKVPRNYFTPVAASIKKRVTIPVITSNRINNPEDAEAILQEDKADIVSMARPFLADPEIITKAINGRPEEINTCIACNQACLDHVFENKSASCMVNPEAGRELTFIINKAAAPKNILIIGAGPAGLEAARVSALKGHHVTLADEKDEIGGQLLYARTVPGKSEFNETLRYYSFQLKKLGVSIQLGTSISAEHPLVQKADDIILASGILPRQPKIKGMETHTVFSYRDVFEGNAELQGSIVMIGGGGIACDLALVLYKKGYTDITLLQRGRKFAKGLGKTTRWITLGELRRSNIQMIGEVTYKEITPEGVLILHEQREILAKADTIITASGQLPNQMLASELMEKGKRVHVIGGAKHAVGLDAKFAILNGAETANAL
ncbi:2,4-dienoyl-CoA reductase [Sinobaca qinghaiensis]|uniref:2,4-dienoyl-CoA reductase n=1 Tax=Sinobaca qinghaiensis TaxID=342944 RepID=A0A419UUE6_9BACL|nr:FAD-dependent oxidoreductase [Sinobaca qinghaiensis]RKD68141.1 2,4-dienoyl-CoA reductase [Sinobaca qinghaiensis]